MLSWNDIKDLFVIEYFHWNFLNFIKVYKNERHQKFRVSNPTAL